MNLTETSLRNPAGVLVAILMVALLGVFALVKLPIQLFPNIEEPVISIFTSWRAAAPTEIESEIIEPQERALAGLRGMQSLNAFANAGSAFLNLQFAVGTDMQATMLEVISRMNQLPPLPRDAQAPQISLGEDGGNGPNNTLSWFFVQLLPGTPGPIDNYRRQIEELFRNRIESIPGVANVRINFGSDEELQIVFDPARAAELGIQIPRIAQVAGSADDVSGGFVDIGRRQYTMRFAGRYSMEQFSDLVLEWRDGRPVRLGDIATVQVKRGDRSDLALQNGNPAIGIQIMKENDANVLETLTAVKAEIASLRDNELKKHGPVDRAVVRSVGVHRPGHRHGHRQSVRGVVLAVLVLWYFVRDRRATLLVGLSIPICLTVTLVMLYAFGRTLNVISLAGLAFGVGQALDTAIVMLEAIAQQREQRPRAHRSHARRREAGVAGAARHHRHRGHRFSSHRVHARRGVAVVRRSRADHFDRGDRLADRRGHGAAAGRVALAQHRERAQGLERRSTPPSRTGSCAGRIRAKRRYLTVAVLFLAPVVLTWALLPPLDYLPPVKRDAIDGFIQPPPGHQHRHHRARVRAAVRRSASRPTWRARSNPRSRTTTCWRARSAPASACARSIPDNIDELGRLINEEVLVGFPDTQSFAAQGNLFGGFGDGRNIDFQLQSTDFPALLAAARNAEKLIQEKMPGAQVQAFQGLEMAEPELRLTPDDRRLNEVGWSRGDIGTVVRALGDGMFVGEYFDGERRLDMILRASKWDSPEALAETPVATPDRQRHAPGRTGAGRVHRGRWRPAPRRRAPNHRPQREPAQRALARPGHRVAQARGGTRRCAPHLPADGSVHYEGNAGSLREALVEHGAEPRHRVDRAVPAAGGAVPLGQGQPVRDPHHSAGELRRRAGAGAAAAVHAADARPADHGGFRGAHGPGGEQRHPAGRPGAQRDSCRRDGARRGRVSARHAHPSHHADHADHALRHVAAGAGPRSRQRAVSRSRHRAGRRHGGELGVHAGAAAHAAAPHRKARSSRPCAAPDKQPMEAV